MPPNKDRLYIALFAHSRPDAYHWAFLVSPKENSNSNYQTIQYHATNRIQLRDGMMKATWELERVQLGKSEPVRLLARILIGKVERSRDELDKSLESVAVVQDVRIGHGWLPFLLMVTATGSKLEMSNVGRARSYTAGKG
ncbi:hypothetical protein LOZ54_000609 [Ophidiomyces ophidiicola]|nr:hypothetical protein LOZ54_000609 [Ophidiomyces ophidiicola]